MAHAFVSPAKKLTPEEYLELERRAEFRSEYWDGEMFLMAGAAEDHTLIAGNISQYARNRLTTAPCRVYQSEMKVGTTRRRGYAYPDVVIVCGERKYLDESRDVLINPTVIFEVLSPSTRAFDLDRKFLEYRKLESLRHYVLVEPSVCRVSHYERINEFRWNLEVLDQMDHQTLTLAALGIGLPLAEIYFRIEFSGEDPEETA